MKNYFSLTCFLTLPLLFTFGCKKNPTNHLANPIPGGAVSLSSGTFLIFNNEVYTGGGIGFIPGGENQSLNTQDMSSPQLSHWQIHYTWNGGDVTNSNVTPPVLEHDFAGFTFPVTVSITDLPAALGKDLHTPGYTTLKFSSRGTLSQETTLRIEGPDNDDSNPTPDRLELTGSDLISNWKDFCLNITASQLLNVKTFMTVSFQYAQPPRTTVAGNGGAVYFSNIRYEAGPVCP